MSSSRSSSLFDDIFQLQSTVPDIDPEDPEDGFKPGLTFGATDVEVFESTQLRKKAAIIPDDPKYRGKKVSRKALHSDSEDEQGEYESSDEGDDSRITADGSSEEDEADDEYGYDVVEDGDDEDDDDDDDDEDGNDETFEDEEALQTDEESGQDPVVLAPSDSSDKEKGKIVSFQVDLWDEIIKCRISLQKVMAACNRLPTAKVWGQFAAFQSFQTESSSAHSSVQKLVSSLLDLQQQLHDKVPSQGQSGGDGMDEEITSESEIEDGDDDGKIVKKKGQRDAEDEEEEDDVGDDDVDDDGEKDMEEDDDNEEEMDEDDDDEEKESGSDGENETGTKRKMNEAEMQTVLAKRHKEFQPFRNNTLEKWDEKTRLSHAKIKSKNFAAFDISVLTQIQQVLGNKDRLIRRIHQNRSSVRPLGQVAAVEEATPQEVVVEDDDDDVELKQRVAHPEVDINFDIVDDSDFYQICLRDFIQLKQNEETDPVLANKYWLEIQNMRRKHKRKVDTRASKGRKIRYHVKEKLKNFMAPYDKSQWSDEQKDDLFKALFGGGRKQETDADSAAASKPGEVEEAPTITIGL